MNRDEGARSGGSIGNPPMVFPSIEAAMANFAKINNPPRFGLDRDRAEQALVKVENGYMLKRDPDNANRKPIGEGAELPRRPVREMWEELAMVKVPTLLVRGLQSDRYPPATVERMTKEYPQITQAPVQSQHDVARMAPDALVGHVKKFIGALGRLWQVGEVSTPMQYRAFLLETPRMARHRSVVAPHTEARRRYKAEIC